MSTVHFPGHITEIEKILNDYHVKYEKIGYSSINTYEVLSQKIIDKITNYNGVYVLNDDNVSLRNYNHDIKNLGIGKNIRNPSIRLQQKLKLIKQHRTFNASASARAQSLYYNPNDLKKIYNMPIVNTAQRIKIGVIQLGGGYNINDLNTYWNYLNLNPKPIVNSISVDRATNRPGSSADVEVYLDIEILGGMCPNSTINVYFAQNTATSFYNAIAKAINDGNKVISISWGAAEQYFSSSTLNAYNSLLQQAAIAGITVCVASGDNGAKDNGSTLSVDFPASSQYVLAVGGTTLYAPSNIYTTETTWTGSGGGFSNFFSKPNYQNALTGTKRCVPDVCANADPNSGYIIYMRGSYYVIGGTSAAAPLWAGFLAAINYTGFFNNAVYSLTSSLHDITSGNNNGYSATVNYDLCTGLGSPDFSKIKKALGL